MFGKDKKIDDKQIIYLEKYLSKDKLDSGIKLLEKGIPVQYIVGNVDFYGYIMKVNSNVLIPRFETELLVEKTINYIKKNFRKKVKIVDVGTGSGCIAITLKKELNCKVTGIDISDKALEVAKENAKNNEVEIDFVLGNILDNLSGKYDILISNPPYIKMTEKIQEIVKNNEPHIALYADCNGLYYYKEILRNCNKYLEDKFLIAFEIGESQAKDIISLANRYLNDINISVEKDYSDKDRFIFISSKDNI